MVPEERDPIFLEDLQMWRKCINREPWISALKYAESLEDPEIYWGDEIGQLIVNDKVFEK